MRQLLPAFFSKNEHRHCKQLRCFFYLLLICLLPAQSWAYYESRPVIRMSEVLKPQQAQSVYHRVDDIELSGKFLEFHVESDMGSYKVRSMALFRHRIH